MANIALSVVGNALLLFLILGLVRRGSDAPHRPRVDPAFTHASALAFV